MLNYPAAAIKSGYKLSNFPPVRKKHTVLNVLFIFLFHVGESLGLSVYLV